MVWKHALMGTSPECLPKSSITCCVSASVESANPLLEWCIPCLQNLKGCHKHVLMPSLLCQVVNATRKFGRTILYGQLMDDKVHTARQSRH